MRSRPGGAPLPSSSYEKFSRDDPPSQLLPRLPPLGLPPITTPLPTQQWPPGPIHPSIRVAIQLMREIRAVG